MKYIAFIDAEIEPKNGKILDIGSVDNLGASFHSTSLADFKNFLRKNEFLCGHNIISHDLKYLGQAVEEAGMKRAKVIDTLYLSPLLFPAKPYHALLKDDKLQTEETNNPLNDAIKARELFFSEVSAFGRLDEELQSIFYALLNQQDKFTGFFRFMDFSSRAVDLEKLILRKFHLKICEHAGLSGIIFRQPVELAYCLALINTDNRYSITPPWVLKNYPEVERVMFLLRSNPCLQGCGYCDSALDIYKGLGYFFGYDSFRMYAGEPLQEKAVRAAVADKSIIAVFPTGGGKSITFQLPALMSGINVKGLTVVISPLQSLMKDQVDNLEKAGIIDAVTINGLLDPIERANSIERVEDGSASILYISPESLRSRTIEKLLLGRNVVRFVIDEAHCFSAWGQDFRVDYLYIGDFIKSYQEKKNKESTILVSCFTATAKLKVIEDIRRYFQEKLSLELEVFSSSAARTNLHYKVIEKNSDEEKYTALRNLIEEKCCPTIIYVSRTAKAYKLALRLTEDGFDAKPYHGKMDKKEKTENQNAFMTGEVRIMVATSAFGMGVDKKDVGMVIHYEISDSLENYVQEAGRAGRDENISADCYVLFNDEDLSRHFILLNQTKLNIQEIQQIWKAIKDITRLRSRVSQSSLELARRAGWEDSVIDLETKVKTAIAALEDAGYIKRGQNMPRLYADSILVRNAAEAIERINRSGSFDEKQKVTATRIIKMLISCRSRRTTRDDEAEARVDYISDRLGLEKEEVIQSVNLMREEKILADSRDLSVYIKKKDSVNKSLGILKTNWRIEKFLLTEIDEGEKHLNLKELNEKAEKNGCQDVTPDKIRNLLNFWAIKNYIKKQTSRYSKTTVAVLGLYQPVILDEKLVKRYEVAQFIVEYLYEISMETAHEDVNREESQVEFSVLEVKEEFEKRLSLFNTKITMKDVEDALFYLSRIDAVKIEGGFLVTYNPMSIERIEQDNKRKYKAGDYERLRQFYENKIQQIHIVGEYAKKMVSDYSEALRFVDDYFQLNYPSFLNKYFKSGRQNEIKRNITPAKFRQLFGELSPSQLKIINDKESKNIVVAAGPGSGKTRILVHKLASLMLMEDVKHEQMLMLTFSRAAATEFKKRLLKLIGNAAHFIEIKTFHSYCFDLLGRIGSLEKSEDIIRDTVAKIRNGEVEAARITKAVLVVDEAQDMDENEFQLITALMEHNEDLRVIAVGDDDQNIHEFRGSSSKYMEDLIKQKNAVVYELVENYRSKNNLVDFSNQFVKRLTHRLKKFPIIPVQKDNGQITICRYESGNLAEPLAAGLGKAELVGSTCILTRTNDEALQVTGLLAKNGLPAGLIQSNDGFDLFNLVEVRYFFNQLALAESTYIIDEETWAAARSRLANRYKSSPNLDCCINLTKSFEIINPKNKYKTDLEIFIHESRLEDFNSEKTETIMVSTIHKAKGREFDNVFLLLDRFPLGKDEALRQLYVAFTRAKRNLTVYINQNDLDQMNVEKLERVTSKEIFDMPGQLVMQLTHKDVWLDYFSSCQHLVAQLDSGNLLKVEGGFCCNKQGQKVLAFSKFFCERIDRLRKNGYVPVHAVIKFIVYWRKENEDTENKILLPELYFEKAT